MTFLDLKRLPIVQLANQHLTYYSISLNFNSSLIMSVHPFTSFTEKTKNPSSLFGKPRHFSSRAIPSDLRIIFELMKAKYNKDFVAHKRKVSSDAVHLCNYKAELISLHNKYADSLNSKLLLSNKCTDSLNSKLSLSKSLLIDLNALDPYADS